MRRKLVLDLAKADPDHHYPIDVLYDLVDRGHNKFAFVKTSIIHLTHSRGFWQFMLRRQKFVEQYHFQENKKRRWSVVMPGDELSVAFFVIAGLTLILPLIDSIKGFIKLPDIAWFINPFMCFGTTVIYGYVTIKYAIKKYL